MDWTFWFGSVLLFFGTLLCISGTVGVLRFPDIYTRLHAASVTDSLGSGCILAGLAFWVEGDWLVLAKLFWVFMFLMVTSPTAGHTIAQAALTGGVKPKIGSE
ncbi:monovalent cation/proton antiporter, MnhG/PhaG subunit [Ferrimonas balearica DSM 9799]|uniref:Monovalent cation/proton antiporter, MnhG/PhaG subunit n=2 Tax=Ferrimonas balearica TaxID=44012 RepID=E1SPA5_FERBD|nr:monovalent cation/H(+) antiporter subunit G [Ferrimonas balearica]ADN75730.1 monovalent cation/proton antiporter, MnhG/PhaG subunit [Ferrimonas balearica DSM 9799]MBY6016210.1 monovalent cation/H(+) antiporter subunit G [Halomonas denitrificans]